MLALLKNCICSLQETQDSEVTTVVIEHQNGK